MMWESTLKCSCSRQKSCHTTECHGAHSGEEGGSRCSAYSCFRWGAKPGPDRAAVVQEPRWWNVTSPFPPSGNEGYIRNRDVPYQSVTLNVTEDRSIGIPTKRPRKLPLPGSRGSFLRSYFLPQLRAPTKDQLLLLRHYPLSRTG